MTSLVRIPRLAWLCAAALLLAWQFTLLAAGRPAGWQRDRDGGWISPNLVRNPSAERGGRTPAHWAPEPGDSLVWDREHAHSGERSLRISGPGTWASDPFALEAGVVTTISVACRAEGIGRWGTLARLEFLNAAGRRIDKVNMYVRYPHAWRTLHSAAEAPAGTVAGIVVVQLLDEKVDAWYDDVDVRQWRDAEPSPAEAVAPGPGVWAFDLGAGDSPVQRGYTRISPDLSYQQEKGFGWLTMASLDASNQDPSSYRPDATDERGEPLPRQRTMLDPLLRDTVVGSGPARFRLDLSPGRHRVFVLAGHSRFDMDPPYFDLQVLLDERYAGTLSKRSPREGYVWEEFTADVSGDGLSIGLTAETFGGAWSVAALVVYTEDDPDGAREVQRILSSVQLLPADLLVRDWRRVPLLPHVLIPDETRRGGRSGGIPWAVFPSVFEVLPTTPLEAGDPGVAPAATVAPGLTADLHFAVRPGEDLEGVALELDPLVGPGQARLDPESGQLFVVDMRALRYNRAHVQPSYYQNRPDVLSPRLPQLLPAGETRRFWLRVAIPAEADPGVYRSRIRLRSSGRPVQEIPLEVRVLPFPVQDAHLFQNVYFYGSASKVRAPAGSELRRAAQEARTAGIRDIVSHLGDAAAYLQIWRVYRETDGQWAVETAFARQVLEDFRRAGHPATSAIILPRTLLQGLAREMLPAGEAAKIGQHITDTPELPEEYWNVFGDLIRDIDDLLAEEGVAERLYNPVDEARGLDLPFYVQVAKVLHDRLDAPQVFCNVSSYIYYGKADDPQQPALEPWCNVWWVYGTISDEHRRLEREGGTRLMGGFVLTSPAEARAASGLLRWRRQEEGGNWWSYDASRGSFNTQLDGPSYGDRVLVYPTWPPSPRVVWEATRQGHEDLRYLITLEAFLAQADRSCRALEAPVNRASQWLEQLHRRVDPMGRAPFADPSEYDTVRNTLISTLETLHAAAASCEADASEFE